MIILYLFRLPCLHWVALDLGDGKPKKFVSLFYHVMIHTVELQLLAPLRQTKKK